jgi:DNA-binding transcriptional ArsR family regulator
MKADAPPVFLQLAGHPLRWHLLSELVASDLRVRELTALVGQPQNAVSYHLARLRSAGLVSMHRSSADRRAATTASSWPAALSFCPRPAPRCIPP